MHCFEECEVGLSGLTIRKPWSKIHEGLDVFSYVLVL